MKYIDLHIHTTASDGTLTPEETVRRAAEKRLAAIAVTDHDTAAGAAEALGYAERYGVEVVPAIEISADYFGYGVHIIGYFVDPYAPALQTVLEYVNAERDRRNGAIIEKMQADGIRVSLAGLKEKFPGTVIGRPHLSAALVENGLCATVDEGFQKYLNRGKMYYMKRQYLSLETAFRVIRESGGKAAFAHPLQYRMDDMALTELTRTLAEYGCVGMECLYSGYTREQSEKLKALAGRFGLCVTGGSDYHGSRKPHIDMGCGTGDLAVPYTVLENLRAAVRR